MWNYNYDNELYHHGVKGMKWGVRRYRNRDSSNSLANKRSENKNIKKDRKEAMKNRRSLSDQDIKKRIDRIKLEREFKSLTQDDIAPGRKKVNEILINAGTKALGTVAAGAMLYGVKYALTGKFDPTDAARYMTPSPKKK